MARYLLVVPVPFQPLPDGRAAVESAFAGHLELLLASLRPTIDAIEVLAPVMPDTMAEANRASLRALDPAQHGITFSAAFPLAAGTLRYLLGLPGVVRRLWRAVGRARFVHAGPSQLRRPFENVALLLGVLRRRPTVYVVDIDPRESPRMNRATGHWSVGVAFRARYLHGAWLGLQSHLARLCCTTLFLKGAALVRDYGRGRPHVHDILDSAHAEDMVLAGDERQQRLERLAGRGPVRACYFGRLVRYKGVDRMLRAVAQARAAGADVTFDVYGGGEDRPALEALAHELGLDPVVRFHGARPYGDELFAGLAACDLLLAAPLSEDTPRSALDAQARGMGVLAFATYYYRDLAEKGAGVETVPWPDVGAMADALVALHADRRRLVELAERGLTFAAANTQDVWLARRAQWTFEDAAR
jgi:glycosyltransferase involved in cell wall biosynthesis